MDKYLKNFVNYCKDKFGDNLAAIVVYGSYAGGYFDKNKSDYDVFVIFKEYTPEGKNNLKKKFKKITLQYFLTTEDLINHVRSGHWTVYITLLKGKLKIVYKTKEYKDFLKKLKKIYFFDFIDVAIIEAKAVYEKRQLKKLKGFKALKWAFPSIRKKLQLLNYIRCKKPVWKFRKVLRKNKNIFDKKEIKFLKKLEKRIRGRDNHFNSEDKKISLKILDKIDEELLIKELGLKK